MLGFSQLGVAALGQLPSTSGRVQRVTATAQANSVRGFQPVVRLAAVGAFRPKIVSGD